MKYSRVDLADQIASQIATVFANAQCEILGPLLAEREGYFLCSGDALRLTRSRPVAESLRDSLPLSFGIVSSINRDALSGEVDFFNSSLGETRLQGHSYRLVDQSPLVTRLLYKESRLLAPREEGRGSRIARCQTSQNSVCDLVQLDFRLKARIASAQDGVLEFGNRYTGHRCQTLNFNSFAVK